MQWIFGAMITVISTIVGYLFNWNTRIEKKIDEAKTDALRVVDEQRREFKSDLEKALDRQTTQIIQLMDARLYSIKDRSHNND